MFKLTHRSGSVVKFYVNVSGRYFTVMEWSDVKMVCVVEYKSIEELRAKYLRLVKELGYVAEK
jgi:hypothetical protein